MYKKPSNSEFKRIFDRNAESYDEVINKYALEKRIDFIKRYAKGKCLEVGAGSGEITKSLVSKHKVVATDLSPRMVAVIRKKMKIEAYVCDAEKLVFKKDSFDTVIAAEMIYLLDSPSMFIKEASRVLRKNGGIIITSATKITEVYDKIRLFLRNLGFSGMYFDDGNREFMDFSQIERLLGKSGFQVVRKEKAIILPFRKLDFINRLFENSLLSFLSSFVFIYAKKK